MKLITPGLVFLGLVFLLGMGACGQGDTSVGVGAGGLAVIDTDEGIVQVNPGIGSNPETVIPINCPILGSDGSVICSCDSILAGDC